MPTHPGRAKSLFLAAIALPGRAAQEALLDRECAQDLDLRRRVEALLRAHDDPQSVLDRPLAGSDPDTQATDQAPSAERRAGGLVVGDVIGGRYKLLEAIGEGGMGQVWVAEQLAPIRRQVALKLIKPGMDSRSILARFEAERQALAVMNHPNIAKVLEAGATQDGRPYFAMELVKGTPITTFCDARRLSPRQRLELFIPVCQAIQHAHQKGIIHRDIKPGNVLVELHDERMVPKVIDFGVAKAVGLQLTDRTLYTGFGALIGTPAYMAPEQATFNAVDIDTRADVYALGVLLYELLAGSPPVEPTRFGRAALDEVLRMVREEDPPPPSGRLSTSSAKASIAAFRQSDPAKLAKLVRGELDWIVMKALEKDRARRYETASALARDVERYLGDEPVEACAPTFGYRLRKACSKHRGGITAAGVIVAVLLLGAIVSGWQAVRAVRSRQLALAAYAVAEQERQRAVAHETDARNQRDGAIEARGRLETSQEKIRAAAYAWDMQMVPLAWEAGNITRADEMLDRHRTRPDGAADLRGFEWHYWDRMLHAERAILHLPGRPASAPGWAMSDNGALVLAVVTEPAPKLPAGTDGARPASPPATGPATATSGAPAQVLKVWDASTGRQVLSHVLETAYGRAHLSQARFSRDNRRLALSWGTERRPVAVDSPDAGTPWRQARVIDLASGKVLVDYVEPNGDVERWNLSPSGKRFAVIVRGSAFGVTPPTVKVWDVDAGEIAFTVPGETAGECSPPFSADGSRFAAATSSRGGSEARVYDSDAGKVISSWKFGDDAAPVLAISPNGGRVAGVLRTGGAVQPQWAVKLWDADAGTELFSAPTPPAVSGRSAQFHAFFNADGSRLAVTGHSQGLTRGPETKVLDAVSGTTLFSFTGRHAQDTQAFSPGGKQILATEGAALTIRDGTSGQIERTVRGHRTRVVAFSQSPDGRSLRSIEEDGTLKQWDLQPADPVVITRPNRSEAGVVAFSADGSMLAALATEQADPGNGPRDAASPASVTTGPIVNLFNSETGELLRKCTVPPPPGMPRRSYAIAFSGDGSRVALVRSPHSTISRIVTPAPPVNTPADLAVWDPRTGVQTAAFELGKVYVQGLALSPDGGRAAVATGGGNDASPALKVFDILSRQLRYSRDVAGLSVGPAWSPDGRRIAGVAKLSLKDAWTPAGMVVKIWDAATGEETASLELDGTQVSIAWSGDGTILAAGFRSLGGLGVVKLLDARTGGVRQTIADPAGPAGNRIPSGLAFSPDGRRIAAHLGGPAFVNRAESEVKLWETATGREMLTLKSTTPSLARLAFSADGVRLAEAGQPIGGIGRTLPARGVALTVWQAMPRPENP